MAQSKIPMDDARFKTGLTWKDYMAQMGDTRARTEENYGKTKLTDDERKFFGSVKGVTYVIMTAENWRGDLHRNSPLIANTVELIPGAELRALLRATDTDLPDSLRNT